MVKRSKIQRANSRVKEPSQPASAYQLTRLVDSEQHKYETKEVQIFNA